MTLKGCNRQNTKLGEIEASQILSLNCLKVIKNTVPITINSSLKIHLFNGLYQDKYFIEIGSSGFNQTK